MSGADFHTLQTLTFGLFDKPGAKQHLERANFEAASWPEHLVRDAFNAPIFWLDRLLKGGFRVPVGLGHPLRVVITGRPGLGKSLFVQQLLYSRLFHEHFSRGLLAGSAHGSGEGPEESLATDVDAVSSIYVTTEASAAAVWANMKSLGWFLASIEADGQAGADPDDRTLRLDHSESGAVPRDVGRQHGTLRIKHIRFDEVAKEQLGRTVNSVHELAHTLRKLKGCRGGDQKRLYAIAFDSVNSLPASASGMEAFEGIMSGYWESDHPLLAIFVCDEEAEGDSARWAHRADVVIHFKFDEQAGFTSQYMSIVKARYQDHVMGRHPVVVCGWSGPKHPILQNDDPMGPRPRLREGGLFVYPNHHFLIDEMRQESREENGGGLGLRFFRPHDRKSRLMIPMACATRIDPKTWARAEDQAFELTSDARVAMLGGLGSGRRRFIAELFVEVWLEQVWFKSASNEEAEAALGGPLLITFGESSRWFSEQVKQILTRRAREAFAKVEEADVPDPLGVVDAVACRRRCRLIDLWNILQSGQESEQALGYPTPKEFLKAQFPILRQRPGSVVPGAFLNRLTYWLANRRPTLVAILGLDSLESLFPQLASEGQFVPTVVEVLRGHRVIVFMPISDHDDRAGGFLRFGLQEHANYVAEFASPLSLEEPPRIVWCKDQSGWRARPGRWTSLAQKQNAPPRPTPPDPPAG